MLRRILSSPITWLVIVVLLVVGIVRAPAQLAAAIMPPEIQAAAYRGTIWAGQAGTIQLAGIPLGTLQWRSESLPPLWRLELDLVGPHGELAATTGTIIPSESFAVKSLSGAISLDGLIGGWWMGEDSAQGKLVLALENLLFLNGLPVRGEGTASWQEAVITGLPLGNLEATFRPSDDGLMGTLSDGGGPLRLDGRIRLDQSSFELWLKLGARGNQPELRRRLVTMGPANENGDVELHFRGPLGTGNED